MFAITEEELRTLKLSYYSDYFSFIGSDERGSIAFALDNNRGQDGDSWQAEHFVVLHDEKAGWQAVLGNGPYENTKAELEKIPDSPAFSFQGTAVSGMTIQSKENSLTLKIGPMKILVARKMGLAEFRLGSAEATMTWQGRTLKGRVIYEYLFIPGFNRLTRKYPGVFNDFHGIYASVEGEGDLYFHTQKSAFLAPLIEKDEGFLFLNDAGHSLKSLSVKVKERSFAAGFYRWPKSWTGSFQAGNESYEFACDLSEKKTIKNWVIGGFSMGIVKGSLTAPDRTWKLYGLGELIM